MNDEQARQLGEYIKHLREECKMTYRDLAARARIDGGGLNRLERGLVREPRPTTLCAVAKALDASVADMYAIAGYTVPQDLPCIEQYLKVKYSCIPADDVWEICQAVKRVERIYGEDPVPRRATRNEGEGFGNLNHDNADAHYKKGGPDEGHHS